MKSVREAVSNLSLNAIYYSLFMMIASVVAMIFKGDIRFFFVGYIVALIIALFIRRLGIVTVRPIK